jgi:ATP-binding protein involved in chromosome partitioning
MNTPQSTSPEQELRKVRMEERLRRIRHVVLVMSGKGGVGKSTVAANLAANLAARGHSVGLLDADVHGPSVPRLLGLTGRQLTGTPDSLQPLQGPHGLRVISIASLVPGRNDAVIWRGPLKMRVYQQLLADVEWGELDFLLVDLPPGTGDEPLSICQLIPEVSGAVVVTTPQELSVDDVRRCVSFCRQLEVPVVGVLENMSGMVCPHCSGQVHVFGRDGGRTMAEEMEVPFLGAVPLDPDVVRASDAGEPLDLQNLDTATAGAFAKALDAVEALIENEEEQDQ